MTPDIVITRQDRDRLAMLVDSYSAKPNHVLVDYLDEEIGRAHVVDRHDVPHNVVTMNSRVRYRDDQTGAVRTVTLVYPADENSQLGRLSILTPVGMALIGLTEGQSIEYATLDGRSKSVTVVGVPFQPEAVGRYDQ